MNNILRWFKIIRLQLPKGSSSLFKMKALRFLTKWFIVFTNYGEGFHKKLEVTHYRTFGKERIYIVSQVYFNGYFRMS